MPRAGFSTVDAYLAGQPEAARAVLETVRAAIRKALPKAEETISYQIPTYKGEHGAILYFAGFKAHWSLYPVGPALIAAFGDDLAPYEVNNKGTIRFPLDRPVPVRLVQRIAKFRAKEVAEAKAGKAGPQRAKGPRAAAKAPTAK